MNDTTDTPSALKQILLKTVVQRDYSIQEVMHHLLSIKFVSATHEVITASLDGSRRVNLKQITKFVLLLHCVIPMLNVTSISR